MKHISFTLILLLISIALYAQNSGVAIGATSANPSALLDLTSSRQGFLPPRMSGAKRDSIINPSVGLIVYCLDCGERGEMQYYDGLQWRSMNMGVGSSSVSLNCDSSKNVGTLIAGVLSGGVNSTLTYLKGNGMSYEAQSIPSTGVLGLTATLESGTLSLDSGSVTFGINGIPLTPGIASFSVRLGRGKSCLLKIPVNEDNSGLPSCGGASAVHNTAFKNGFMIDIDGNIYKTIIIGTKEWMAENLKVSRYKNGDIIPLVTDGNTWLNTVTAASCWYNNDSAAYNCPYGKLYNFYVAEDPRGVCPTGWHVPSDAEFSSLMTYLGGSNIAAGKMKSVGTQFWVSPNTGADNSAGFSVLPGGYRSGNTFGLIGTDTQLWSSTFLNATSAWNYALSNSRVVLSRGATSKKDGYSIRCIRD